MYVYDCVYVFVYVSACAYLMYVYDCVYVFVMFIYYIGMNVFEFVVCTYALMSVCERKCVFAYISIFVIVIDS